MQSSEELFRSSIAGTAMQFAEQAGLERVLPPRTFSEYPEVNLLQALNSVHSFGIHQPMCPGA